jgi:hypothetical protein
MGSAVDSRRIDDVISKHKEALLRELREELPSKLVSSFTLQAGIDAIGVRFHLADSSVIDVPKYWDVDILIERFPDCA